MLHFKTVVINIMNFWKYPYVVYDNIFNGEFILKLQFQSINIVKFE